MSIKEKVLWRAKIRIDKYDSDIDPYVQNLGKRFGERTFFAENTPYETLETEGNLLMTAGANALWTALTGGSVGAFSATNAALGVGDAYGPGTISLTSGSPLVTGTGTSFLTDTYVGMQLAGAGEILFTVQSIQSATSLTATANLSVTATDIGYQAPSFVGQTNLFAGVNAARAGMSSGFPAVTNNQVQFQATFGGSVANFYWNEWGVFNSIGTGSPPSGGVMFNRALPPGGLGMKATGTSWTLTVTLSLS